MPSRVFENESSGFLLVVPSSWNNTYHSFAGKLLIGIEKSMGVVFIVNSIAGSLICAGFGEHLQDSEIPRRTLPQNRDS